DGAPINLETPIQALDTLSEASDSIIAELATALQGAFDWPGRDTPVDRGPAVVALTESQQELFDMGRDLYQISCGACHQPHGMGQDGLAPPLKDSDWTTGSKERMIRIALHGLQGPIEVHGKQWELIMPGLAVFEDQQLASILTYVRRSWGHTASPVESSEVTAIRAQHPDREDMWTVKELLQIK
ncbi:MAG: cytochrome c, partial [Verrucomicrobiota bacterium]|nr:cytochrome c [Verrucomicrobiota bacterium]